MKRLFPLLLLTIFFITSVTAEIKKTPRYNRITKTWNSYADVTIRSIQFNQLDSLLLADTIQQSNNSRWTLQIADRVESTLPSPWPADSTDDTVTVVGLCVVPPKIIGYTANGFTMVLYDTNASNTEWGGIVVRCNAPADTAQNILDNFLAIERGDVVRMTGRLSEFPTGNMNSLTQLQPIPGIFIDIVDSKPIPAPIVKGDSIEQFYNCTYNPAGPYCTQYSTGERYEGMAVELRGLTIVGYRNVGGRSAIEMIDDQGNTIAMHDASRWFTVLGAWRDPASTWTLPPVLAVIDTIRGVIIQISGGSGTLGYVIAPMFPGDVVFGIAKPTVNSHARNPNIILQDQTFNIQARAKMTLGGWPVESVFVKMSINYGVFDKYPMEMITTDSIYEASFFDLAPNTFVRYFIEATDTGGQVSRLAYQGAGFVGIDTAQGFFNFTILDHDPKISDIQYTMYSHGVSPYYGATATLRGIITADTSDLELTAHSGFNGTTVWFMQDGTQPWSGIWLTADSGSTSMFLHLRKGDSVAVSGRIGELNTVTQMYSITSVTVVDSNKTLPQPILVTTGTFAQGSQSAEQYEGMLVKVVGTTLVNVFPYFSDPQLYEVSDGTGGMFVGPDGKNLYTHRPGDSTLGLTNILYLNDKIDTLIGVMYYASGANRYTICPRQNSDYVAGEPYQYSQGWNLVSVAREQTPGQTGYNVSRLFPTAVSQPFMFAGGYLADTAVWQGVGYWLKFGSNQVVRQLGKPFSRDTIEVVAGWNLVGMLGESIAATSVDALPEGNALSSFFGYDNGYDVAATLNPSQGYWVKSDMDGSIIMSSSGFAKQNRNMVDLKDFNSMSIEGKNSAKQTLDVGKDADGTINLSSFELPPSSPQGEMDARFVSGRILETYPAMLPSPKQFAIALKNVEGSVTVKWNIVSGDTKQFVLSEAKGNKNVNLKGSGEATFSKSSGMLFLTISDGGVMPKEFSLSQNYPNPFNPSTQFVVGLLQAAHLEVSVYNILGQKVATLVNENRDAGFHTVVWNSTLENGMVASSGVYFVKMNAGEFSAVKKIVLMK
ncbi:MAG: T9SS type A sorting domain-containing protein [Ignavibacteriae bacterium]|nr:T9SS type A sorting domain-containing protein [Ignavibacteriota bacterium]